MTAEEKTAKIEDYIARLDAEWPKIEKIMASHELDLDTGWRVPIPVTELKVLSNCPGRPAYYVCPQCELTMEREFMFFCDRCGQRLSWRSCQTAKTIYCCPYSKPNAVAAK